MEHFEYKVVPAPRRGSRVKGVKGPAGRFANALESLINELAATGWEYIRAESLPVDERQGLTMRKTESYQNVLIFRKVAQATDNEPTITALLEDQTASEENDDLFDEGEKDFPDEDEYDIEEADVEVEVEPSETKKT